MKGNRFFLKMALPFFACLMVSTALAKESIVLPEGLKTIGAEAFYGAGNLEEVVLPAEVTTIDSRAFAFSGLERIHLTPSLVQIADDAFEGCEGLTLTADEGTYAFLWAKAQGYLPFSLTVDVNMHSIDLGETVTWTLQPRNPAPDTEYTYQLFSADSCVYTQSGAETILSYTPQHAGSLQLVVTAKEPQGAEITVSCEAVEVVQVTDPADFAYRVVNGEATITGYTGADASLVLPRRLGGFPVKQIGRSAFSGKVTISDVTIQEGVKKIDELAFNGCTGLRSVRVKEGLESIGESAFYNCIALDSVQLPAGLKTIGSWAFERCIALRSIELPEGLTSVSEAIFDGCSALQRMRFRTAPRLSASIFLRG